MSKTLNEKEVVIKGEYELSATLTTPEGTDEKEKYPAILLINGTGVANRDGNMKKLNINIYKQLADYLSSLGFITLRYDKRGVSKSGGDHHKTGMNDLIEDIISNVKYLQSLPSVDPNKVILLGHSEGSILATITNTRYPVAGLILLGGAGTSLKTAMQSQNLSVIEEINNMKGIKGALLRKILTKEKVIAKQNKLFDKALTSTEDVIKIQFQKFPAKWLREHLSYTDEDVLKMLKETECPVLAATGDKDVQADSNDLQKIKAFNKGNIHSVLIKDMDHILREYKGQKTILNLMKQYKGEIDQPLHPQLKEEIKVWCIENFK